MDRGRLVKEIKMLPVLISCEIKAVSPTSDEAYSHAASMWAKGTALEILKLNQGTLFSWEEKVHMTFGESSWYSNISSLNINTRRAIGIIDRWRNFDLVATISALPAVASILSASLPKVLEVITKQEVTARDIRVKLGSFLHDHYDEVKDQLHHLEWLRENGQRGSIQRKDGGLPVQMPPDNILNIGIEGEIITAEHLPQLQGIVALGLNQAESWWVLSRTLSIQIADVTSSFNDIGSRTEGIVRLLRGYIDEVK